MGEPRHYFDLAGETVEANAFGDRRALGPIGPPRRSSLLAWRGRIEPHRHLIRSFGLERAMLDVTGQEHGCHTPATELRLDRIGGDESGLGRAGIEHAQRSFWRV